jgi:hypothetical protein
VELSGGRPVMRKSDEARHLKDANRFIADFVAGLEGFTYLEGRAGPNPAPLRARRGYAWAVARGVPAAGRGCSG